jgi:hypothetical protein
MVSGLADFFHAWRGTIFDDVVEAMPKSFFIRRRWRAGAQPEVFFHQVQRVPHRAGVGERSEVTAPVVFFQARELETRERLVQIDLDHEQLFVVAKTDVVFRPIFLDETAFENNRLGVAPDDVKIKIPNALNQRAGFDVRHRATRGTKILPDPLAQIPRLADVNHAVESVFVNVHARLVRQRAHLWRQVWSLKTHHTNLAWKSSSVSVSFFHPANRASKFPSRQRGGGEADGVFQR